MTIQYHTKTMAYLLAFVFILLFQRIKNFLVLLLELASNSSDVLAFLLLLSHEILVSQYDLLCQFNRHGLHLEGSCGRQEVWSGPRRQTLDSFGAGLLLQLRRALGAGDDAVLLLFGELRLSGSQSLLQKRL